MLKEWTIGQQYFTDDNGPSLHEGRTDLFEASANQGPLDERQPIGITIPGVRHPVGTSFLVLHRIEFEDIHLVGGDFSTAPSREEIQKNGTERLVSHPGKPSRHRRGDPVCPR